MLLIHKISCFSSVTVAYCFSPSRRPQGKAFLIGEEPLWIGLLVLLSLGSCKLGFCASICYLIFTIEFIFSKVLWLPKGEREIAGKAWQWFERKTCPWISGDPEDSVSCFWCQLLTCASSSSQSGRRFLREHMTASQWEQGPIAGPSSIERAIFEPSWECSYSLHFQACYTVFSFFNSRSFSEVNFLFQTVS